MWGMDEMHIECKKVLLNRPVKSLNNTVNPWTSGIGEGVPDITGFQMTCKVTEKLQSVVCLDFPDRNRKHHLQFPEEVHGVLAVEMGVWVGKGELHPHIDCRIEIYLHPVDDPRNSIHLQIAEALGIGGISHPDIDLPFLFSPSGGWIVKNPDLPCKEEVVPFDDFANGRCSDGENS